MIQMLLPEETVAPPLDPINAMLSLGYSVLSSEIAGICSAFGLDAACGLLHAPRFGRSALALDIMEEFRPLIWMILFFHLKSVPLKKLLITHFGVLIQEG